MDLGPAENKKRSAGPSNACDMTRACVHMKHMPIAISVSSVIALLPRATAGAGLIWLTDSVVHNCCESIVQGVEHKCQRMGH